MLIKNVMTDERQATFPHNKRVNTSKHFQRNLNHLRSVAAFLWRRDGEVEGSARVL